MHGIFQHEDPIILYPSAIKVNNTYYCFFKNLSKICNFPADTVLSRKDFSVTHSSGKIQGPHQLYDIVYEPPGVKPESCNVSDGNVELKQLVRWI